ncbi:TetR/AcrR family transcriptional regulator [Streptomyces sp. NBC_01361]|uniref:TetR/AcrR family transcriptional regulator n=1 Tax=Streptomyces sp. NBC_01361 TaxID=2903838 RepID=UPI002E319B89|nr:TetR/AcrR family transcriptional regulator [Streptomyces sp. NBC_01361]
MPPPPRATGIPDTDSAAPHTASGSAAAAAPPPPVRRPGGRTARNRAQVLDAVRSELVEHGYDALTVDAVADRAGVHRTTVYRRWGDVGGLLADVLNAGMGDDWEPADTGTLYGDLAALNHDIQTALSEQPSVTAALIAASFRSEQAARALRRFWDDRYTRCEVTVERAVERGDVPPDTAARPLLVAATAPLYHQLVLLRAEPDPLLPDEAARSAALAASAGIFTRSPSGRRALT